MALEDAEQMKPGYFYSQLIAITLSGLALEAICNAFGEQVISEWKDYESASPIAKLRVLCEALAIDYNKSIEPWSTAFWLYKFRNKIAHAKPELVKEEFEWTREEYDSRHGEEPLSKIEKEITLGNAKKSYKCVYDIKKLLSKYISIEGSDGLEFAGWHVSGELK